LPGLRAAGKSGGDRSVRHRRQGDGGFAPEALGAALDARGPSGARWALVEAFAVMPRAARGQTEQGRGCAVTVHASSL